MKAVLTRVKSASVRAHGQVCGEIQAGFLILLGIGPDDTEKECKKLAEKALGLRIFEDADGKMNLGLQDVGGQVLVVSQFTLYADCKKDKCCFYEKYPHLLCFKTNKFHKIRDIIEFMKKRNVF